MKNIFFILAGSFLITSCATILNGPYKAITVYTTEPSQIFYDKDTLHTSDNKTDLIVLRGNESIHFVAKTDSLTKSFDVKPINSSLYWSNILFNYGVGMLIERKNPKRFSYPKRIYINSTDTINRYFKYGQSNNKGELYLHLSLPHINSFRLTPENESAKINTGFWGFTIGLDYYHSKSQFLNLGFTGVADFFVPFPAAVDLGGEHEIMSSLYTSISNNHKLKRFSIGYGLSYAQNTWDFRYYEEWDAPPPSREPVVKKNRAIGLVFPLYYEMGQHFNLGVIYRPTFYRPNLPDKFVYEHLISIDFAWKIRLKK